jgi:transposase
MESVKKWLSRLQSKDRIACVTMDLWNPYRLAIQAILPKARIIADKYHVVRQANEVVETVRKSLRETLSPSQAKQLKQDRKILLKREKDLTDQQRFILESWTGFIPLLHDLFQVKEQFFRIYDAGSAQDAYERYQTWQQQIPPTLAEAFRPLQQTVAVWEAEIFAFFETKEPLTNAYTERANLSIREATRICYGLDYQTLRAKLLFCPSNTAARLSASRDFQPQEVFLFSEKFPRVFQP